VTSVRAESGRRPVPVEVAARLDERTLEILEQRSSEERPRRRGWLVRRMLAAADLIGITASFLLSFVLFSGNGPRNAVSDQIEIAIFVLSLPAWLVVAKLYGLYDADEERTDHSTADELIGVFHLVTIGSWLFFGAAAYTNLADPSLPRLFSFWGLAIVLVTSGRAAARVFCRRRFAYIQNTVIVGAGDVGQLIARKLRHHPEYGVNVVGFVDSSPKQRRPGLADLAHLGAPEDLPQIVDVLDVERAIISFTNESHEEVLDLIRRLRALDVQIDLVPRLFEIIEASAGFHTAEGLPLIGLPPLRLSRSSLLLKRTMDIALAALGLLVLAPFFVLIAAWIRLDSPGPVFFRQIRMGTGDKTFVMLKFRTMTFDAEARKREVAHLNKHLGESQGPQMFKIPDDPRVTRPGRFLRRFSLDELPQLINVIVGEMSLVGPRPLILEEDAHVIEWRRQRLSLKPGITGAWQVLGRDDIPFEEMVRLDYLYVTTWSITKDFNLILRTLPAMCRARSSY
jgi:exopolysaccharide biosynthesis polyprenyl glycosylphosphotransferase